MATGSNRPLLRNLIEAPEILILPGVYDGFSARLVETAGYPAAFITGSGVSESRIGRPDVGISGLAEAVDVSVALTGCTDLLLFADADTGYGNAVNVHYTVRALERSGVADVMIEDQTFPKRCGHVDGKDVISPEEMVGKVEAAVNSRTDSSLVIMARTDAAKPSSIDEGIRRSRIYAKAGADIIFPDAIRSAADTARYCSEVDASVAINMGFGVRERATTLLLSSAELQRLGVAATILPRMMTAAAIRGMQLALAALKESLDSRPNTGNRHNNLKGLTIAVDQPPSTRLRARRARTARGWLTPRSTIRPGAEWQQLFEGRCQARRRRERNSAAPGLRPAERTPFPSSRVDAQASQSLWDEADPLLGGQAGDFTSPAFDTLSAMVKNDPATHSSSSRTR